MNFKKAKNLLKKLLKFIGPGIAVLAIMLLFMQQGWLMGIQKSLQNKFYDYNSASSEIIIVAIDENSLQANKLGGFTKWKREYYAKAIDILNEQNAAAIGIDVTFPDSSIHGDEDDQILSNTLEKYDNVVLAARYYFEDGNRIAEWPNDTLMKAKPDANWINIHQDEDGFVRMIPIFAQAENKTIESFSLQLARFYMRADSIGYRITHDKFAFSDDVNIPSFTYHDPEAHRDTHLMYVNYFAEPNSYTHISFSDLLDENFIDKNGNPINFIDKIVIIGSTAIDLQDDYLSPVSRGVHMSGAEVHANNVQTIIEKEFLRDQSSFSLYLVILALIILNIILFSFLRLRYTIPIVICEIILFLIAGIVGYEFRIFVNVIYPVMTSALSFTAVYLMRFISEESEKKYIQSAFGRYVSEDVVEQIIKNPRMLELGGVKRDITVFFSDIEGFTTISENMEPHELVAFLNEYLTEMTDIILKYQGTIDKYEGDAIMAIWNAPLEQDDHVLKACLTALENNKRLKELSEKWKRENLPEIKIRIGINTGEAVTGNMGSKKRFSYTAMGDNVNLASRLEGVNKEYGTDIIISSAIFEKVKSKVICRELDLIRVKGRKESVRIYELIDSSEGWNGSMEVINIFAEGLALYRENKFAEAKEKFEENMNDSPSVVFAKRCVEFLKNPPAQDWDGVWVFNTK